MSTAAIVGLGLVGGSLARDLLAAGWTVQGSDLDPDTEEAARELGVEVGAPERAPADVLVLAVPVRTAPPLLRELARRVDPGADGVITDVGSTKRSIAAAARRAGVETRFVGAHPMAGDHRSGWSASRQGLFRGATVWICPGEGTPPERVERVESLWRAVGARPRRTDPATHDRRLARASHLPQLAASALAVALQREALDPAELGPGGRDTTRLAASSPELWRDILLDNRDEAVPAIDALIGTLLGARGALEVGDGPALRRLLAEGADWRARVPRERQG
jgi:prephenate dehydrogenase